MKCIVCSGELTEEEPGKISGEIIGSASGNPNQKYEKPKVQAYHDKCEREAHKLIWGEDKKRYRRMGVI